MRSQDERHAAHELLRTAVIVPFGVVAHEVKASGSQVMLAGNPVDGC